MPLPFKKEIESVIVDTVLSKKSNRRAAKAYEANVTANNAAKQHEQNAARLREKIDMTNPKMDELGLFELSIIQDLGVFSDTIEMIRKRPRFGPYKNKGVKLPKYDRYELKNLSLFAGSLLGYMQNAAVGTAGCIAASGARAGIFETYSVNGDLSSKSSTSNTKAVSTALKDGNQSIIKRGIEIGKKIVGDAIVGADVVSSYLIYGSFIDKVTGIAGRIVSSSMSKKADETQHNADEEEKNINEICGYLDSLYQAASLYMSSLAQVKSQYDYYFSVVSYIVNGQGKNNWRKLSNTERSAIQNTVLLASLLYKMCNVNLVNITRETEINRINAENIDSVIKESAIVLREISA